VSGHLSRGGHWTCAVCNTAMVTRGHVCGEVIIPPSEKVAAGHGCDDKSLSPRVTPESPLAQVAGGSAPTPTAEILSFQRGEQMLRPAGTRTANLWRRNRRWAPSNSDVYTPPEPRTA
jgi:hypothetical protein